MKAIKTMNGVICGYGLPIDIVAQIPNVTILANLHGIPKVALLPPIPELLKIKGLVQVHNLSNKLLGFSLPTEINQIKNFVRQFNSILDVKHEKLSQVCNIDLLDKIQSFIDSFEIEENDKKNITKSFSQVISETNKSGEMSFDTIINLINLLIVLVTSIPTMLSNYQKWTDSSITEICGILNELEKEAVKFVEVEHRGGVPLFQYSKGKKEVGFLLNGTQICMLSEPKGNIKRVRVVYQSENNKQIYGYVERNKLKRLYK